MDPLKVVSHHPHVDGWYAREVREASLPPSVPGPFGIEAAGFEFNARTYLDEGEERHPDASCMMDGEEMEQDVAFL